MAERDYVMTSVPGRIPSEPPLAGPEEMDDVAARLRAGAVSILNLTFNPVSEYARFSYAAHADLDKKHALGLTRFLQPEAIVRERLAGRFIDFNIRGPRDLTDALESITREQRNLSHVLLAHGGGVRSLTGTYFNPQKKPPATGYEMQRGWQTLRSEQENPLYGVRTDKTGLAMFPRLTRIFPAKTDQKNNSQPETDIRATGYFIKRRDKTDAPGVMTASYRAPQAETCERIRGRLGDPSSCIHAIVTPIVWYHNGHAHEHRKLDVQMIIVPDYIFWGGLPRAAAYSLALPHKRRQWQGDLNHQLTLAPA